MSKILIVGNSLAVTKAIENIRQNDQKSEIVLFCTESVLPYDRFTLPSLVAGLIKESKTHPLPEDFFKENRVEVIANEKLLRISLKRKYLTTEKKTQIDYDQLMIADLGTLTPLSIKGHQKKGVFDCALLSSVKELIKYLPFADTVFVSVTNFQGFNMACALHAQGKEVVIVTTDPFLLSNVFDEETSTLLKQIIESKGIRVMANNSIDEILGDSEVKAVRLQSAKVAAAQIVIVDGLPLDWQLVEQGSEFQVIDDEYFLMRIPFKPSYFGSGVLEGFCMGMTKLPDGGREYLRFDAPQNVFKKIFAQGDCLVGTVLFNAPVHEKALFKIISESSSVVGQEEALLGG
ncbi:MAG: FAD-dependent oxidoreductase [Candidatus Omnitrophica bacterium]|nr:FAD-dependent oxidoreductase [Candidatus Omnitrophota bacterium]